MVLPYDILTAPLTIAAIWPPVANNCLLITMSAASLCNRGSDLTSAI